MNRFESSPSKESIIIDAEVEAPADFVADPFGYFERVGINTRPGTTTYNLAGRIKEDPTAVKDLPPWHLRQGDASIGVVAKRVNRNKARIADTQDPLHEFTILSYVHEHGLPGARPLAHVAKNGEHLLVMEKLEGVRLPYNNKDVIIETLMHEHALSKDDAEDLLTQATVMMAELSIRFDQAHVMRRWHIKDMVLGIDFANKKVTSVMPVDWERTYIKE